MNNIGQTVSELQSILRRSAECRRELASKPADWALLPDALTLLDDLDEQAVTLVTRAGLVIDTRPPPEPASRAWRKARVLH